MVLTLTTGSPRSTALAGELDDVQRVQVMEQIVAINPTAARAFLDGFSDGALAGYLRHLQSAQAPRGRMAYWVRTAETSAATVRDAQD